MKRLVALLAGVLFLAGTGLVMAEETMPHPPKHHHHHHKHHKKDMKDGSGPGSNPAGPTK
jgi:hypothetical protein